ncbi:MAG: hypothetical protein TUN42_10110 [Dehalogenimonas sp.]
MKIESFAFGSFIVAVVLLFSSTVYGQASGYNPAFNAEGMKLAQVPSGHVPGKDNGPGLGLHNTGEDCGICHTPNGKAGNYVFTVGGTIYQDREARNPLKGAEVILQDYSGKVISMTTNELGNFWTYATIASNPYTIASHGNTETLYSLNANGSVKPADASDPRTWQYKAWVKNPDGTVVSMITVAPIGGATKGSTLRMGCSMHHSPFGSTGAVWSSRTSTLASYPSTSPSFKKDILPIFLSKCAPCHVPGKKATRLVTASDVMTISSPDKPVSLINGAVTSIDYSNGRDFTSYDGSFVTIGTGATAVTITKPGIKDLSLIFQANPDASPLLVKTKIQPNIKVVHGGGSFWTSDDPDYKAIRQWIAEGARNN